MSTNTTSLLELDLFKAPTDATSEKQVTIEYHRARAIARTYDILHLTPRFWRIHWDPISAYDFSAHTLLTIQYNLAAGTLAPFLKDRPDLKEIMDRILNFDISAQFLLTEVGHGLDARNLETTATLLPSGEFELHTPHCRAAKYMPPTSPQPGFPRIGIVMARLIIHEQDKGIRPFVVWLNDGHSMCKGVFIKVLPRRTGLKPIDHSITTFNHVRIPGSALLGPLPKQTDREADFHSTIWRVHVGTLALATTLIPMLKRGIYVAGKYSLRRRVTGHDGSPKSIISFRTQQRPILRGLAQALVFDAFAQASIKIFMDQEIEYRVRHGVAATFKAVLAQAIQSTLFALAERCGAQGLFQYNGIIESQLEARGISIAEGDTLALCNRLASELLLGRYSMPAPENPSCLLARYERGIFSFCRKTVLSLRSGHRSEDYNTYVLPHCQTLVEAIGHRIAYEAAHEAGVDDDLLALYEATVLLQAQALYIQESGLDVRSEFEKEAVAMDSVLPRLNRLLDATDVGPYCTAAIVSDESWDTFVDGLQAFGGEETGFAYTQESIRSML
ncbi:putative acyl-CoA oxidase [Aspergillus foveolatus]|uniref:putative acyl-CoA oxidase n=1 Tax=Aspergillus foveolatus TaxID=210207 RepID=UPI003CCD689E